MQIDVAVEEIFVNVASYAYQPDTGPVTLRVEKLADPLGISITLIDHGVPFDPTTRSDPDVSMPAVVNTENLLRRQVRQKRKIPECGKISLALHRQIDPV